MTDINARLKLSERKEIHKNFEKFLNSSKNVLVYSKDLSDASEVSEECIHEVAKYANKITEDIAELKQLIKKITVQIGVKVKKLVEDGLLKEQTSETSSGRDTPKVRSSKQLLNRFEDMGSFEGHSTGNLLSRGTSDVHSTENRLSRDRFDMEKAKELEALQRLAAQQYKIQQALAETEGLMKKVEEEGFFAMEDIDNINRHLNKWIDGLETEEERRARIQKEKERKRKEEEEKKRREKEEAERKAREKRNREEEERRKKEEERKRKAEQEKQEEERKARIQREEELKRKEEEERKKREREEAERKAEEERKREEEEKRKKEEERKRKDEEKKREEERKARIQREEERKRKEEEEKKKREKEEAERRAEEKRKREEDEEKRKREEERKQKEEQKRKEEEEKNRRNPDNWPIYLYEREKSNSFHSGICCVVSAITGSQGLEKDDIICSSSDSHTDLERYSKNQEEILISSLIKIKSKTGKEISLELPMKVFIPSAPSEVKREVILRVSVNGREWRAVNTKEEKPKINTGDTKFVATNFNHFQSLECLAVSRPKRENMIVKASGGSFEPTDDKNVRIIVSPGCFRNNTDIQLKVDKDLGNRAKADKHFNNIKIATSLHGIEFGDDNLKDIDMEIYPNLDKIRNVSLHQKTIERCRNKLVTDISVLRIATRLNNNGKLQDSVLEEIKNKNTEGMRARRLLEEFNNCDAEQFNAITDVLEKENQGHLANFLKKTMEEIKEEEDNSGSDFIGDIVHELQMVTSCKNGAWEVMEKRTIEEFPDGVIISLRNGGGKFDIMGLIVPKNMDNTMISRMAEALYRQSYQINAKLLVRQNDEDAKHCLVRCVGEGKVSNAANEMRKQGFQRGPPDSPVFGICDGETISIKMTGNIVIDSVNKEKSLKFYLNIESAITSLKIDVLNKRAQASNRAFSGELEYNVGSLRDQGPPREGSIVLHIPKEDLRFAPLTLDVPVFTQVTVKAHGPLVQLSKSFVFLIHPVKVSAKYIAWKLSSRGGKPSSDDFLLSLVDKNSTKCRSLKQRATKEAITDTTREICELFIKNWAMQRPKSENKVNTLATKLRELSSEFSEDFGILSNNGIEELSKHIHNKWEILAQKLGFDEMDIDAIKIDCKDDVRRAVYMLDKWRLSDGAIEKGADMLSYLANCMERANCSQTGLKFFKTQK